MLRRSGWILTTLALCALPGVDRAEAQNWRTLTSSRQVSGEDEVTVEVKYAAGRFTVKPGDGDSLYDMTLTYDEDNFEPVSEYRRGILTLGVDGIRKNVDIDGDNESRLDLLLTRRVPMDLKLEFGAVKADFDLSGVPLKSLSVTTGASESLLVVDELNPIPMGTVEIEVGAASFKSRGLGNLNAERINVDAGVGNVELDLTGEWNRDGRVSVDMGLGALTLTLSPEMGIRLTKDTFLTGLDAEGLEKRNGGYYSANWDTAEYQLEINVDAAFGKIEVVWAR
jgi:hypothetical protein